MNEKSAQVVSALADDDHIMLVRNRPWRLLLPLFLVRFISVLGLSTPGSCEEFVNFTYHRTVSEVRLLFFATDEHNRPVEGLQRDDFAVVDDERVIRDFRSFTPSGLAKLDVIVLIDSSESVLPTLQQEIADAQQLILRWPGGLDDRVSVLLFGGKETQFVCAGDCRGSFAADVASVARGGKTPLFDAMGTATAFLMQRKQPDVWPMIILFSDGEDTTSKSSFHEALEKVLVSAVQVYAIDVSRPEHPSSGAGALHRIANDSGGRYIRINEGAVRILNDILDDLHSARVVTYLPPESSSDFHSIRILPTRNLNFQFRCRRGYYYRRADSAQ